MKLFSTIESVREQLNLVKTEGNTIGLVPTMGALHDGHLELVRQSNQLCDVTIASVFVNPTQFNNPADLQKYPRKLDHDIQLLESENCDFVFSPSKAEMYSEAPDITLSFGEIENNLEGEFRPGHFNGVGLIVSKLFNIIEPSHAFFGQKDLQQFFVIQKLISQLNYPIKLIRVPIVREESGLAMSSRNERLKTEDRQMAGLIYETLKKGKSMMKSGATVGETKAFVGETFDQNERMNLEYFEIVETRRFSKVSEINQEEVALCIAVNIDDVRLIDNLLLFS